MCEEENFNDIDVENDNDIGKVLAQMWIDYATRLLEKFQILKCHINLNHPLGLELVQELKQIEPYDYGNINHFSKDYIQDRYNAEKEYKYTKLIWGDDEGEDWEYLKDILVPFYEIDHQEQNN
ncbi:unnamed protein product [Didymodactylos carnosus]|uniref:Uncharacterized protein n=1 Tax=Didymodactylos carnosus TaxID=1234261 RepID=A0A815BKB3_9BILA|nr:unnamed protein product [Didymodactylos carnosus]CAF4060322.1 unnamed protein product [Didymodactylos carnosus]